MKTLPIGLILVITVMAFVITPDSLKLYLNAHSLIIVFGGTFSVLVLSTSSMVLLNLGKALVSLTKKSQKWENIWQEFKELDKSKSLSHQSHNPLIRYAVSLWEAGVSQEYFVVLLSQKRADLENEYLDATQALKNLSKYPPALGMTGTVIGLVSLFSSLGEDTRQTIGPALALAMTATFFGLILANVIINPIADRLHVESVRRKRLFAQVYQILLLINKGEALALVQNEVENRDAA